LIREKLIFKVLQEEPEKPKTPAQIFGANYYDDWDFNDLTTISESSGLIDSIDSKTGSGRNFTSSGVNRPLLLYAPNLNKYIADFDGVSEFMSIASSTGDYNFLHDGSAGTMIVVLKNDNINTSPQQRILMNFTTSTDTGIMFGTRNTGVIRTLEYNGGGSNVVMNNEVPFTDSVYHSIVAYMDSDNATPSERSGIDIDDSGYTKNNTDNYSPAPTGDATYDLHLGRQPTISGLEFNGKVARVIIIDTIPTSQQLSDLQYYLTSYYGTFPI